MLPTFSHPFQGRQPKIVAPMHQALVRLAQMRGILAHPDFVRDDAAGIAFRRQEPGVIEAVFGAGCRAGQL